MTGERSVEGLRSAFEETLRRYDVEQLEPYLELMHDDVTYSIVALDGGAPIAGLPAIREMYRAQLASMERVGWESIEPVFVVAEDVGMVFGRFRATLKPVGEPEVQREGRQIVVFAWTEDGWLKVGEHI
jgi:ketosteroid isomerase-like protein